MRRVDIRDAELAESVFARNIERDTGVPRRRADDFEKADISTTLHDARYISTVAAPSSQDSSPHSDENSSVEYTDVEVLTPRVACE